MAETDVCATESVHPLDAIATLAVWGDAPDDEVPPGSSGEVRAARDLLASMPRPERLGWVAAALGVSTSTVKTYDPDRGHYDLYGETALYRYFDAEGRLLYVGVTRDPAKRDGEHVKLSPWRARAHRRSVEWYASRPEALAAERSAIRSELPAHNILGAAAVR